MEVNGSAIKTLGSDGNNLSCSLAIVDSVIIEKDEVLLKVTLQPTGEQPMIRMAWDYVGNGFGLYVLPNEQDEIICAFPNNDLNRGICIKRLNNGVDIVPESGEKTDFGKISQEKILLIGGPGFNVDVIIKGDVKVDINGKIEVVGNTIKVTANESITIEADTVNVNAPNINVQSTTIDVHTTHFYINDLDIVPT